MPLLRFGAFAVLFALVGCSWIPLGATTQSDDLRRVWTVFLTAAAGVYAIVAGLILWCVVAYRRRGRKVVQAADFHQNAPLEIAWTVIPILIVIGLFLVTYPAERHVESVTPNPDGVVQVIGFRWSWRFLYPREHVAIEGGTGATPNLVLPVGRTTEIKLSSSDVVHAFWVPAFLFKRDATPGREQTFDLTPRQIGVFPGRCAEFCGTDHATMTFTVRVVSPADYAAWLAARKST
ncbi:MAG: cytochrome c oxidase subunit II [Candidatus Eremiobacteraeota bacterium]|nr:cytochrome c oxidase subunit II [Candidatus Eremiobacteraeota bacterium]MBV8355407.1 cytochrome c oxidase subunit II [Candidatus Eremiobacteraeota bacterium]